MKRFSGVIILLLFVSLNGFAQKQTIDTLGISNGTVHMKSKTPYTKFIKKYKGETDLVIHIWYNPSGSATSTKDTKVGKDEVHFFYGRNNSKGLSEMGFKFGSNAVIAFSKKKESELIEFIDFFEFEVFPNSHFNASLAKEALDKTLE